MAQLFPFKEDSLMGGVNEPYYIRLSPIPSLGIFYVKFTSAG